MAQEMDEGGNMSPPTDSDYETDINDLLGGFRLEEAEGLFEITREQYVADRKANTRGTANPSVMNNPFWMSQIGPGGVCAWDARTLFASEEELRDDSEDPVWCFRRFGATRTKLPDGRVVYIGGEHEDFYDRDFFIYNDVVVVEAPQNSDIPPLLTPDCIKIYGYPVDVFPPTDYHTSTYHADSTTGRQSIFIIGGFGYDGQASRDRTEVYRLDLTGFSIQRLETAGAGPTGQTCNHKAELLNEIEQPAIKITVEEVKECTHKRWWRQDQTTEEEGKEPTRLTDGEEFVATAKDESPVMTEEDEESSAVTRDGKELVATKESKVFTLRIHDMRWI